MRHGRLFVPIAKGNREPCPVHWHIYRKRGWCMGSSKLEVAKDKVVTGAGGEKIFRPGNFRWALVGAVSTYQIDDRAYCRPLECK